MVGPWFLEGLGIVLQMYFRITEFGRKESIFFSIPEILIFNMALLDSANRSNLFLYCSAFHHARIPFACVKLYGRNHIDPVIFCAELACVVHYILDKLDKPYQ